MKTTGASPRLLCRRAHAAPLSALCLLFVCSPPARTQEVEWRSDYNKARQEALDSGRPLIIDFGTETCFWCKQLDQRTFSDATVASLLNGRCIPLRIDAQRTPKLAEALHIQNYPTLVFASPDGQILGYKEGFVEPAALKEQLDKVVAAVAA